MKAKELENLFLVELNKDGRSFLEKDDPSAILFGTDQFKINFKKEKVFIPGINWTKVPGINKLSRFDRKNIDWVAVVSDHINYNIVLGASNPYEDTDNLPVKNGHVVAIPSSLALTLTKREE